MIVSIFILALAGICALVLLAYIVTELVSFVKRSFAKDSVDGITVDDLVKFTDGPLLRVDSIVRNNRGQWIIVDDHLPYVIERDTEFSIWS
jgi:hypothetical protein